MLAKRLLRDRRRALTGRDCRQSAAIHRLFELEVRMEEQRGSRVAIALDKLGQPYAIGVPLLSHMNPESLMQICQQSAADLYIVIQSSI